MVMFLYGIISGILSLILVFFFLTQVQVLENAKYLQQSKAFIWGMGLEDRWQDILYANKNV